MSPIATIVVTDGVMSSANSSATKGAAPVATAATLTHSAQA